MSDSVERLRLAADRVVRHCFKQPGDSGLMSIPADRERDVDLLLTEAADEIESLRSRLLDAKEQVAALESREVCTVAHDNVETCGYCQRDELLAERALIVARAENAERALEEAERDAALGRIAIRFVDRAGDYCEVDPAERICDEFSDAMAAEVERQWQARVARDAHLSRKEQP